MSNIQKWINKNRNKLWFSIAINLLMLGLLMIFLRPSFEENDDITMSEYVNGVLGVHDPHLIFENYLLGLLLRFLYMSFGTIPWYAILELVLTFTAFTAITYVLLNKINSTAGTAIAITMLTIFGFDCYIKMQFTKVSGVLSVAGIFLVLFSIEKEKIFKRGLVIGWILGCMSAQYRYSQFFACAALLTGIGLYFLLTMNDMTWKQRFARIGRYALVFGSMVVVVVGIHLADAKIYESDPEWDYYLRYNYIRGQLFDFGLPDYENHKEVYESLGMNEDAYILFDGWDINDPEILTIEAMETLMAARPEKHLDLAMIKTFIRNVIPEYFSFRSFYFFLIALAVWLVGAKHSWRKWLVAVYEILLFGVLYFYIYYSGRYLINRVDVGWWLSISMAFLWFVDGERLQFSKRAGALLCLGVFFIAQRTWSDYWRSNTIVLQERADHRALIEQAGADKDHLYLAKVINTMTGSGSFGPFDQMPENLMDNICWLGGWETNSVPYLRILEKYDIKNPYRDVVDNEKVYLVENNIDLTVRYIQHYYNKDARAVEMGRLGIYPLYQIVTTAP